MDKEKSIIQIRAEKLGINKEVSLFELVCYENNLNPATTSFMDVATKKYGIKTIAEAKKRFGKNWVSKVIY